MQVKEGDIGYYKIFGKRKFPENDKEYFIVVGKDNFKRLIPSEDFVAYNFSIGDRIKCRIDKVNCNGRIFLEPEHPVYKNNHSYELPIIERIFLENNKNAIAIVKDCFSNPLFLIRPKESVKQAKSFLCSVAKVKKGNLFLVPEIAIIPTENVKFKILKRIAFGEKEVTILIDSSGDVQYFFDEAFTHYNLEIGQEREFKAIGHNSSGNILWEPVHPYFKIGKTFSFVFLGKEEDIDPMRGIKKMAILQDEKRNLHKMLLNRDSGNIKLDLEKGETINCKIDKIKRGKVYLDIVKCGSPTNFLDRDLNHH